MMRERGKRGQSLIGMLASLVIMCILVLVLMNLGFKRSKPGQSMPAKVTRQAENISCMSLLQQYRAWGAGQETPPKGLKDFGSPQELRCPICGMDYRFDPSRVQDPKTYGLYCAYPGHRSL